MKRWTYLGIGLGVVAFGFWWFLHPPMYMSSNWLADARRRY